MNGRRNIFTATTTVISHVENNQASFSSTPWHVTLGRVAVRWWHWSVDHIDIWVGLVYCRVLVFLFFNGTILLIASCLDTCKLMSTSLLRFMCVICLLLLVNVDWWQGAFCRVSWVRLFATDGMCYCCVSVVPCQQKLTQQKQAKRLVRFRFESWLSVTRSLSNRRGQCPHQ